MSERFKSMVAAYGDSDLQWNDTEVEKFALLIVQKCIETIQNASMHSSDEWEDGLQIAEHAVREHFGVEEHKGWVCPYCGTDRTRKPCPQGDMAAVEGRCPIIGVAQ